MTKTSSHSLHNIQMLRAIAAILVVMHHMFPHYQVMGGKLPGIYFLSEWGFFGVDIFFVISGFIMAYTTFNKERNLVNAKTFFKHRLFRVYLGYWPFFFLMLAALYLKNPQKLSELDMVGSFFLTNADMFHLIVPVSWSLSFELYFYFLFLFTFLFSIKQLYLLVPVFVAFILLLVLYLFFNPEFPQSFFYSPFLLEFFAGVLLFMYKDYLMKLWILPLSLIIAVIAYYYGVTFDARNGLIRVLTFGTGALFIVLSVLILERHHLYRAGRKLESIGNASYTLYLSHIFIIQLFYTLGLREVFTSDGQLLPFLGLFGVLLFTVLFSLIYYRRVEKPIYQKAIGQKKV